MRHSKIVIVLILLLFSFEAQAQTWTFSREGVDYTLELPSRMWRVTSRLDIHDHVEFVYGDDYTGSYLRMRKNMVNADSTAEDLYRRDEMMSLRHLPGYVECNGGQGVQFNGYLPGQAFSYEYTNGGKAMAGRIYYVEVNPRIIYSLHFTGDREGMLSLLAQMDSIAKSFRLK